MMGAKPTSEPSRTTKDSAAAEPPYDISVAARLTGLTPANLRAWEHRYQVVAPDRSESGRRVYSEEDVRRLTLLKHLSDRGIAIRKTFEMSTEQLESLLLKKDRHRTSAKRDVKDPLPSGCRLIVVGENLLETLRSSAAGLEGTQTVQEFADFEGAEGADQMESADLILIECATLFDDTALRVRRLIERSTAIRAIVVYHFAQTQTIEALDGALSRITAVSAPISVRELQIVCAAEIGLAQRASRNTIPSSTIPAPGGDDVPARHFSDSQLARIAQIDSNINCECPHHLANIITGLVGFEKYSAECESRNAADAAMHAYLHKVTAQMRASGEEALKTLLEFERLDVGQ